MVESTSTTNEVFQPASFYPLVSEFPVGAVTKMTTSTVDNSDEDSENNENSDEFCSEVFGQDDPDNNPDNTSTTQVVIGPELELSWFSKVADTPIPSLESSTESQTKAQTEAHTEEQPFTSQVTSQTDSSTPTQPPTRENTFPADSTPTRPSPGPSQDTPLSTPKRAFFNIFRPSRLGSRSPTSSHFHGLSSSVQSAVSPSQHAEDHGKNAHGRRFFDPRRWKKPKEKQPQNPLLFTGTMTMTHDCANNGLEDSYAPTRHRSAEFSSNESSSNDKSSEWTPTKLSPKSNLGTQENSKSHHQPIRRKFRSFTQGKATTPTRTTTTTTTTTTDVRSLVTQAQTHERQSEASPSSRRIGASFPWLFSILQTPSGPKDVDIPGPPLAPIPTVGADFCPFLGPQRKEHLGRHTLVLDLDETLVHSSFVEVPNYNFTIQVEIDKCFHRIYVSKRPGVDRFLKEVARNYEVVLFTASLAIYADPLMDQLDPTGICIARLFRERCVLWNDQYVKDLARLGRDLDKIIIVDNTPGAYAFQPENAIPIGSWFDDQSDDELTQLIPVLAALAEKKTTTAKCQN